MRDHRYWDVKIFSSSSLVFLSLSFFTLVSSIYILFLVIMISIGLMIFKLV